MLVVERVYHRQALLELKPLRLGRGLVVVVPHEPYLHSLPPVPTHGVHLDARRGERHAYHGAAPEHPRREGDALGVVSGGAGDDTPGEGVGGEGCHLVVRAADLEGEDGLGVLPFEEDCVVEKLSPTASSLRFSKMKLVH